MQNLFRSHSVRAFPGNRVRVEPPLDLAIPDRAVIAVKIPENVHRPAEDTRVTGLDIACGKPGTLHNSLALGFRRCRPDREKVLGVIHGLILAAIYGGNEIGKGDGLVRGNDEPVGAQNRLRLNCRIRQHISLPALICGQAVQSRGQPVHLENSRAAISQEKNYFLPWRKIRGAGNYISHQPYDSSGYTHLAPGKRNSFQGLYNTQAIISIDAAELKFRAPGKYLAVNNAVC